MPPDYRHWGIKTRITINNNMPHLKSLKNQNRRSALVTASNEITWGGGGGGASTSLRSITPRPYSASVHKTLSCLVCVEDS